MQNKYSEYKEVSYQICKGMQACVMIDDWWFDRRVGQPKICIQARIEQQADHVFHLALLLGVWLQFLFRFTASLVHRGICKEVTFIKSDCLCYWFAPAQSFRTKRLCTRADIEMEVHGVSAIIQKVQRISTSVHAKCTPRLQPASINHVDSVWRSRWNNGAIGRQINSLQ